jgi:hypothetical protein
VDDGGRKIGGENYVVLTIETEKMHLEKRRGKTGVYMTHLDTF